MMRLSHAIGVAVVAGGLAGLGSCSDDNGGAKPPTTTAPSAASAQVLALTASYKSWSKFPDNMTPKRSAMHENTFVVTYQNDVVAQATAAPLPDGAVIVKENYGQESDPSPMALTIMNKQGADWYWIKATPDGKVFVDPTGKAVEGKGVAMCLMCHDLGTNDGVIGRIF